VALTVICTVGDSQQTGFSSSALALTTDLQSFLAQTVLPEQKTTPVLAPFRATTETLASRKQSVESCSPLAPFAFGLPLPAGPPELLSRQITAGETTRGPPLMDPPRTC